MTDRAKKLYDDIVDWVVTLEGDVNIIALRKATQECLAAYFMQNRQRMPVMLSSAKPAEAMDFLASIYGERLPTVFLRMLDCEMHTRAQMRLAFERSL